MAVSKGTKSKPKKDMANDIPITRNKMKKYKGKKGC